MTRALTLIPLSAIAVLSGCITASVEDDRAETTGLLALSLIHI